jgi:Fe-coproporphyrin III synthase
MIEDRNDDERSARVPVEGLVTRSAAGQLDRFRPFPNPFRVVSRWALFNIAYPLRGKRPFRPLAMCLYVTYRCNMRCQMCGIWSLGASEKAGEWSVAELARILDDPLFSRLEFVNLNGGEPNLRTDLVDIAGLLLAKLPRLRNLTLNTNGLPSERCVDNCQRILALCRERHVRFGVSVSLHRLGPTYDEIAGIPDAFRKVTATLDGLKPLRAEGGFFLSTNCVLTPLTLPGATAMLQWGVEEGIPVNFTVAEARKRFSNLATSDTITFTDPEARKQLAAFLRHLSQQRRRVAHHAVRYRELAGMVESDRPRTLACHYALAGLILGWEGSIYYCKKSEPLGNLRERPASEIYYDQANLEYRAKNLIEQGCRSCLPNTFNSLELQRDLLKLVTLLR